MHRDAMNAMADFRQRIRNVLRMQTAIDWLPGLAAVITTEGTCSRNRDGYSFGILLIQKNCVQTQAACTGLPLRAGIVFAQSR